MQMVWVTTKRPATTMEAGGRTTLSGRFVRRTIIQIMMTIVLTAVALQFSMTTGEEPSPGQSRQFHRVHVLANRTRIDPRGANVTSASPLALPHAGPG
jgi:hypothetical protein